MATRIRNGNRTALGAAMLVIAAASSAQAQQLLTNADFEQGPLGYGAPGWTVFNDAYTSGEFAHTEGGKSFKVYGPFFASDPPPGAGGVQSVPATAGQTYNLKGFVLTPTDDHVSGRNLGLLQLQFRDAGNNVIPGAVYTGQVDSTTPGSTWIPFDLTGVAPAGTTNINVFIGHIQIEGTAGGAVYFDDLALTQVVAPSESNWIATSSGGWLSGSNWQGGVIPNAVGAVANFGSSITGPTTVTIAGAGATAGTVRFNNAANSYTVGGPGNLTLDVASGSAALTVQAGNHTISAPLVLNDSTVASVVAGGSLTVSGPLTFAANTQLSATNGGTLRINASSVTGATGAAVVANGGIAEANVDLGNNVDVTATAGEARLNATQHIRSLSVAANAKATLPDTATSHIVRTSTLNLDANGTLDIGDNGLVVDYTSTSPAAAIRTAIAAGKAGGFANKGITSTKAVANSRYTIGYAEASAIGSPTTFLGEAGIDSTTVLIRSTLKGDASLNGTVAFEDLVSLAQNYNGTNKVWSQGDFDYDGDADFEDLVALAQNYNGTVSINDVQDAFGAGFASDFQLASALVPEPTTLAALGMTTLLLRRRR